MGGVLLIHGDARTARRRLEHGLVDWSAGVPLVLEKHGYLDVTPRGPEALGDPVAWGAHDVVLIGAAVAEEAGKAVVQAAGRGTPTYVDGPVGEAVREAVGVRAVGTLDEVGEIVCRDLGLRRAATRFGRSPSGPLGAARVEPDERRRSFPWSELPSVGIAPGMAGPWSSSPSAAARWELDGGEVVVELAAAGSAGRHPAIVRHGSLFAGALGLLDHLVRAHTSPPHRAGERWRHGATIALELTLLGLIDEMHRMAGAPRARIGAWPDGIRWVRSVRHEVTTPVGAQQVRATLQSHQRGRSAATWYWRAKPRHDGPPLYPDPRAIGAAGVVADQPGHEVALQAELLWTGAAGEREVVEAASGRRVLGVCVHLGEGESFSWQGAANVLWAEDQGLSYTELLGHAHLHPHRTAVVGPEGEVRLLDVLCLPRHVPFRGAGEAAIGLAAEAADWIAVGGMLQISTPVGAPWAGELFDHLGRMPPEQRADWTAAATADWWRRTHTPELRMTSAGNRLELSARRPIEGLVVEILTPRGEERTHVVSLAPGVAATLPLPSA